MKNKKERRKKNYDLLKEDIDFVTCQLCGCKKRGLYNHIKYFHRISIEEYLGTSNDRRLICSKYEHKEILRGKDHPMYGKHHTEYARDKLSKSRKGKSVEDMNHSLDCRCFICRNKRGEPQNHKSDCKCSSCKAKRGEYKGRKGKTWEEMFGVEGAIKKKKELSERTSERNTKNNPMKNTESRKKCSESNKRHWELTVHKHDCKCISCRTKRGEWNHGSARSHNVFMGVNFLSKSEFKVAKMMFDELGIVPIQGTNCHLSVNGGSIDFYLFGCFIEYHPMNTRYDGRKDKREYYDERRNILCANGLKSYPLIHLVSMIDVKELIGFLKNSVCLL